MVLEHRLETTHNDPVRHWAGDHGEKLWQRHEREQPELIPMILNEARIAIDKYVDVHNWKFTPETFCSITNKLAEMEFFNLRVERTYGTFFQSVEFYALMRKLS